ncbi:sigma 54-interacting transcriptional regulator [Polyangium mundeleinium]|uniref:Sigma 54-interacting transcriptional regulator n=1 Tax=Polyangium mundeleinium TaxID=2995306 RepID=A0ABT5EX94_9BACT|nr:sigma 54-interacting transcriptional regulator [Polyangium mundeleinium]MDC0746416.1 sigma 54-interacting transcriptional regulator [Polyangium mundeleinium]
MATDTAASTTDNSTLGDGQRGTPAQPYLFVVLHCDSPLSGSARYGLADVDVVSIGRGAARTATRERDGSLERLVLRLPGNTISSSHAGLARKGEGWVLEDKQSKNGSFVNGQRITRAVLNDGDIIEIGGVLLCYRAALPTSPGAAPDLDTAMTAPPAPGLATLLPGLAAQLAALERIARMPVPVLLLGETGSGKEVLAHAVHTLSGRPGPFVAVNCGGLPTSLLESQFFGHVKGSFTGAARDEPGYVRAADGGTLFLDEVGDLPLLAQAALLRVLQEREVVPVGRTHPVKVDLRVVAATHKPLAEMVIRGEFRGDLLARLSGYRHTLLPLRERREDLGVLIGALLRRPEFPAGDGVRLTTAGGRRLLGHDWPLNIRELAQLLSVAVALADGGVIEPSHLPDTSRPPPRAPAPTPEPIASIEPEALRSHLMALLEKHQGKVSHVARDMGKARMQIHRWMQRFGLNPDDFRG